jgi:hypothetical protein
MGTAPPINIPFNREMGENGYNLNMSDLLPRITKEDLRNTIMNMKRT